MTYHNLKTILLAGYAIVAPVACVVTLMACDQQPLTGQPASTANHYDLIIRHGDSYDGSGDPPQPMARIVHTGFEIQGKSDSRRPTDRTTRIRQYPRPVPA